MNSVAEAASTAPAPASETVIAVRSPKLTPGTVAQALSRPRPSAYDTTSITVGPGMASSTALASAKAIQISSDMGDSPLLRAANTSVH